MKKAVLREEIRDWSSRYNSMTDIADQAIKERNKCRKELELVTQQLMIERRTNATLTTKLHGVWYQETS